MLFVQGVGRDDDPSSSTSRLCCCVGEELGAVAVVHAGMLGDLTRDAVSQTWEDVLREAIHRTGVGHEFHVASGITRLK